MRLYLYAAKWHSTAPAYVHASANKVTDPTYAYLGHTYISQEFSQAELDKAYDDHANANKPALIEELKKQLAELEGDSNE